MQRKPLIVRRASRKSVGDQIAFRGPSHRSEGPANIAAKIFGTAPKRWIQVPKIKQKRRIGLSSRPSDARVALHIGLCKPITATSEVWIYCTHLLIKYTKWHRRRRHVVLALVGNRSTGVRVNIQSWQCSLPN